MIDAAKTRSQFIELLERTFFFFVFCRFTLQRQGITLGNHRCLSDFGLIQTESEGKLYHAIQSIKHLFPVSDKHK